MFSSYIKKIHDYLKQTLSHYIVGFITCGCNTYDSYSIKDRGWRKDIYGCKLLIFYVNWYSFTLG